MTKRERELERVHLLMTMVAMERVRERHRSPMTIKREDHMSDFTTSDDHGPPLRYTNERARALEQACEGFTADVNADLHALLTWAESLRRALAKREAEVRTLSSAVRAAGVSSALVDKMIADAE